MCELWGGVVVASPLTGFKDGYAGWLAARGYTPVSTANLVRLMANLAKWMAREGVCLESLTWDAIDGYVGYRQSAGYTGARTRSGLRTLTDYLREAGAPLAPAAAGPGDGGLTADFGEWLARRGANERTARRHVWWIAKFVGGDRGAAREPGWLTADRVERFVTGIAPSYEPGSMAGPLAALRQFAEFSASRGLCPASLAAAVPKVKRIRQLALPETISPDTVADVLAGCEGHGRTGIRDAAIVALTTDLGLRSAEISRLTLDDLDWAHSAVTIRGKNGLDEQMPLTARAGRLLARWLRDGREVTSDRRVFHTALAPRRPMTPRAVTGALRRSGRRAGAGDFTARGIRHSLGCAAVAGQGTLQDAGQLLRHLSATATTIYARVEVAALRELAVPWPGSQS
jgi:site-specific recombinase XerD